MRGASVPSCDSHFLLLKPNLLISTLQNVYDLNFLFLVFANSSDLPTPCVPGHVPSVCTYMLRSIQDPAEDVAIEACEFWAVLSDSEGRDALRSQLPALVPALMSRMVYTEEQVT